MPRNGSGTYSLPAGNPVTTGTTISSTWANNTLTDLATAMTSSIAKDGQTTPTANLPMGTYKLTGLGTGSASTDSVNLGQVQAHAYDSLSSVSGVDTITATAAPTLTAYAAGKTFRFVSAGANTGAVTLNIDGVGARAITKLGSTALAAGDIPSGAAVEIYDDGTRFQLIGLAAQTASSISSSFINNLTTVTLDNAADYVAIADGSDSGNAKKALIPSASDTAKGLVELSTATEFATGTDADRVPSVKVIRDDLIVAQAPEATTSGSTKDKTGIPSWAKRVMVHIVGVSTTGASNLSLQGIVGGSAVTSGYVGGVGLIQNGASGVTGAWSTYINLAVSSGAGTTVTGTVYFERVHVSNTWMVSFSMSLATSTTTSGGGYKAFAGALEGIRLTSDGGSAFDAGEWAVSWE